MKTCKKCGAPIESRYIINSSTGLYQCPTCGSEFLIRQFRMPENKKPRKILPYGNGDEKRNSANKINQTGEIHNYNYINTGTGNKNSELKKNIFWRAILPVIMTVIICPLLIYAIRFLYGGGEKPIDGETSSPNQLSQTTSRPFINEGIGNVIGSGNSVNINIYNETENKSSDKISVANAQELTTAAPTTIELPVPYKDTLNGFGPNGATWEYNGYIIDDIDGKKQHGKGKITYSNGDWYNGDWAYGAPTTGNGAINGIDNTKIGWEFVYEIINGEISKGTITWANGDWLTGNRWGNGICTNGKLYIKTSGGLYEGDLIYKNERYCRQGTGTMTWENGDKYTGDWVDGLRYGNGIYYYASTGKTDEGRWVNDKYMGK